jgi:hypothetical protein
MNAYPKSTVISTWSDIPKKELFAKLRLGGSSWIVQSLDGIKETADLAEKYYNQYRYLFWNNPSRHETSDSIFVSIVIHHAVVV